jgi:hypothetical protein
MKSSKSTVIVIRETNRKYDYDSVKSWFASSAYNACEANDLFEALDCVSDFTNFDSPDIVLVRMEPGPQLDLITQALDGDRDFFEVPVAVLSDAKNADEKRPYNFGSLRRLKGDLDSGPAFAVAHAVAAK